MPAGSLPRRGETTEVTVTQILDFGVRVDVEGLRGLIHINDLAWHHVNHPSEIVSLGERLTVHVLDVDEPRARVLYGLKQTTEDPWRSFLERHEVGQVVCGPVVAVKSFGAFVRVAPMVEGLLRMRADDPRARGVSEGARVAVRIAEIDDDRRRLTLELADPQA